MKDLKAQVGDYIKTPDMDGPSEILAIEDDGYLLANGMNVPDSGITSDDVMLPSEVIR